MYTTLFSMINKSRCMAIIICFCSTCCDWIYSQSFKPTMLTQGSSWTYVRISETGGWTRSSCVERWSVDGDTTINQRHYDFLTVEYAFVDGDVQTVQFNGSADNIKGQRLCVREENGIIYALKAQYEQYINNLPYHPKDIYYLPCNSEEVILYDFTLHEGDQYPLNETVFIDSAYYIETKDRVKRRVLVLSNGCILIEGIGAINAVGTLVAYQNYPSIAQWVDASNQSGLKTQTTAYLLSLDVLSEQDTFENLYYSETDFPLVAGVRLYEGKRHSRAIGMFYDLSGRRLSAPPAKGLYIQDKRVKIRE